MGGYWVDSPDNPFNQMSYTRGGGGYDNSSTTASNDARAFAMQGAGAAALPHFATPAVAQSVLQPGSLFVTEDNVMQTAAAAVPAPVTTGPGAPAAVTQNATAGSGPGAAAVVTAEVRTKGAGSRLAISATPPLKVKTKDEATGIEVGGLDWQSNPWFSNTEEWEARYGEPGDLLGGVVVFGADAIYNAGRFIDHSTGARTVSPRPDVSREIGGGLPTLEAIGEAFARQDARWSQQLHRTFGTGKVVPMGGF